MADHDESYRRLFSHPQMVADLLRGFVREPWVDRLDFSTLERRSGSFVSDDLRGREDDLIWRVRCEKEWLYIYLLLEFQSTVDPFMAVRIMVYVGLLYEDLIREKEVAPSGRLPPVLPVVLYNGRPRWTAPQEVAELVEEVPGGLGRYRPRLRYLLLAENEYGEAELASLHNLAAALFRLENSRRPEDLQRVLAALVEWAGEPEHESLRRAFVVWLRRVLLPRRLSGVSLPEFQDLQEVRAMLAERVIEWTREWREQGLEEGRREGRKEGLQEGEATLLIRQMERKFGPLTEEQRARVLGADPETLLEWGVRVLTAERWEDVVA